MWRSRIDNYFHYKNVPVQNLSDVDKQIIKSYKHFFECYSIADKIIPVSVKKDERKTVLEIIGNACYELSFYGNSTDASSYADRLSRAVTRGDIKLSDIYYILNVCFEENDDPEGCWDKFVDCCNGDLSFSGLKASLRYAKRELSDNDVIDTMKDFDNINLRFLSKNMEER